MTRKKTDDRNILNDLTGTEWLKFLRTWFTAEKEPGRAVSQALQRIIEANGPTLDAAAAQDGIEPSQIREWADIAGSWLVVDSKRYLANLETELHPARYPEELVEKFIRFFTKANGSVFDPFAGSGATLVSCWESGRYGTGVELSGHYAEIANRRLERLKEKGKQLSLGTGESDHPVPPGLVLQGDARNVQSPEFWEPRRITIEAGGVRFGDDGLPQFDFIMTSPPYWNMLRKSRGGVKSTHKKRAESELDTHYSDIETDLGNTEDYGQFLTSLSAVFESVSMCLRPGGYMVVVAQNMRAPDGSITTLAWDIAKKIGEFMLFQGEKIWCQNTKFLGIWGYPKVFVPNYHHHYCLIFRKRPK